MILYPAIDIKDGACVRLLRGDMDDVTVYNASPADQATTFAREGFEWLHLVDLNGAVEGKSVNSPAIEGVIAAIDMPIQLGGGIRSLAAIENWLERGISRIVLGTVALHDPSLVHEACRKFPGKIAIGIDGRDGFAAVSGWTQTSTVKVLDLALQMEQAGAAAIIFTDINRDGAMGGVNLKATMDLAYALNTPVIASGGVSSLNDLAEIYEARYSGIAGVICGRALYDGRIDPESALSLFRSVA